MHFSLGQGINSAECFFDVDPSGKKPDEAEKPTEVKTEERPSEEKKDSDMKGKIKMGPEILERKKQRPPP